MRFDQSCCLSACEWIDSVDEKTLYKIIKRYGEERYSKRIAREIIYHREKDKINAIKLVQLIISRALVKPKHISDVQVMDNFSFITVPFELAEKIVVSFKEKGKKQIISHAKKKK